MQSNAAAAARGNKRPFKIIRRRARAKLAELVITDFAGNSGGGWGLKGVTWVCSLVTELDVTYLE